MNEWRFCKIRRIDFSIKIEIRNGYHIPVSSKSRDKIRNEVLDWRNIMSMSVTGTIQQIKISSPEIQRTCQNSIWHRFILRQKGMQKEKSFCRTHLCVESNSQEIKESGDEAMEMERSGRQQATWDPWGRFSMNAIRTGQVGQAIRFYPNPRTCNSDKIPPIFHYICSAFAASFRSFNTRCVPWSA